MFRDQKRENGHSPEPPTGRPCQSSPLAPDESNFARCVCKGNATLLLTAPYTGGVRGRTSNLFFRVCFCENVCHIFQRTKNGGNSRQNRGLRIDRPHPMSSASLS